MEQLHYHSLRRRYTHKPGPSLHILHNLPIEFTQRQNEYFIHNTITLKNQYAHLEELFEHYLNQTTHQSQTHDLTHLRKHSSLLSKYPTNYQLHAFIIAYSPIPSICNQLMTDNLDPRCLTILRRLHNQPPHTHPMTQHIHNIVKGHPITIQNLKREFPHISQKILEEVFKCTQPIKGYHPNTRNENSDHTPPTNTHMHNHHTTTLTIFTWNTCCISSSLPGIQELTHTLHKSPRIILIQETKIKQHKSTSYIDRKLQNYKIIYNNFNNTTCKQNRYTRPTMARGVP